MITNSPEKKKKRVFSRQELMLFTLHLLHLSPNHGYGLIKIIENYSNGEYIPSAGVMYPALNMLIEQGFVAAEDEKSGKRMFAITLRGVDFMQLRYAQLSIAKEKINQLARLNRQARIPAIEAAFDLLKLNLRAKQRDTALSQAQIDHIVSAISTAAHQITLLPTD